MSGDGQILKFVSGEGEELGRPAYRFDAAGWGTFGSAYSVIEEASGSRVGLLKCFHSGEEDVETRLKLESETLKSLRGADGHAPKLLTVGSCLDGLQHDHPAILMEYIDGYTLEKVVRENVLMGGAVRPGQGNRSLDARQTVVAMRCIAQAVVCCHAASLEKGVHRDLSPKNIMLVVRPNGTIDRAVLIDFGQAAQWGINTIGRLGTLWFSAPELFGGDFHADNEISARGVRWLKEVTMDIWSLGTLTYYLRMGARPFLGWSGSDNVDDYPGFAKAHQISLVEDLRERSTEEASSVVDLCLEQFIAICTSYDPHDRFQSAAEALGAIERIQMDPVDALSYLRGFRKGETSTYGGDTVQTVLTIKSTERERQVPSRSSRLGVLLKPIIKKADKEPWPALIMLALVLVLPSLLFLAYSYNLLPMEIPPFAWLLLCAFSDIESGLLYGNSEKNRVKRVLFALVMGTANGIVASVFTASGAGERCIAVIVVTVGLSIITALASCNVSTSVSRRNDNFITEAPQILISLAISTAVAFAGVQLVGNSMPSLASDQGVADPTYDSWGPQDRETFTWDTPASYATFNSIVDNPVLGDERNFVRVREAGTSDTFTDDAELVIGREYEVYIYYHNNASANLNESGEGLAQNVRLSVSCPGNLEENQSAIVRATLSSSADPATIFDTAYLIARDSEVTLSYVSGSAVLHNDGSADGTVLDDMALWSEEGVQISYSTQYPGVVPGCNEYAGYVTFRLRAS